jgi:hypothetical protein
MPYSRNADNQPLVTCQDHEEVRPSPTILDSLRTKLVCPPHVRRNLLGEFLVGHGRYSMSNRATVSFSNINSTFISLQSFGTLGNTLKHNQRTSLSKRIEHRDDREDTAYLDTLRVVPSRLSDEPVMVDDHTSSSAIPDVRTDNPSDGRLVSTGSQQPLSVVRGIARGAAPDLLHSPQRITKQTFTE